MKAIAAKMIEDGINQGIVKPVLDDGELICKIGDCWFYFGGHEFENTDPSEIPFDILVNEIMFALEDLDEYLYYLHYLNEHIGRIVNG